MKHFLRAGFKKYGLRQEEIAKRLGYTQPRVSQILTGKIPASRDIEIQLLKLLLREVKQNGISNQGQTGEPSQV